uniref:Uncharacterized protein n=1 Tax=uncultured Thiotrichaceae bacterium TaxID=298394 RepID=A0A6S6UKF4_9GAMM|nr:MAG: Unknown protein [uncultured Thiotrichaceae bacterium]
MKILYICTLSMLITFSLSAICLAHTTDVIERPGADITNITPSNDTLSFEEFLKTVAKIKENSKNDITEKPDSKND